MLRNEFVVLTRSLAGNRVWQEYLAARGFRVYCLPTIETVPLPLTPAIKSALLHLSDYDWLLLTSATSVHAMQSLARQAGVPLSDQVRHVAAIGRQTARAAQAAGLPAAFVPSKADSVTLGRELAPVSGTRIFVPQTTIASDKLTALLHSRGARVTALPIYETRTIVAPDRKLNQLLERGLVGCLTFASPSAVAGFIKRVNPHYLQKACELPAIAIGPEVATVLSRAGFRQVYTSGTPSIGGITEKLQQLISDGNS